jgi:Holliday junction resolvase RusA-like endonuclease
MKLVISGDVPALKNQKQIFVNKRTGKPFITSSVRSKAWQATAVDQLRDQFKGLKVSGYPIGIAMEFYYPTKRAKDLDNSVSAVLDALVHAGVIEDDNINFVDNISASFGGYDKEDPRCVIYLDD